MDNRIILGYWDFRGRIQVTKWILEYIGAEYENKIYKTPEEWFAKDKVSEPFKNEILRNLPYIKDGDKYIFESKALPTYVANRFNRPDLLGQDCDERVRIA